MTCRGVRGATTVDVNEREAILAAARELLLAMAKANAIQPGDLAAIFFTCTADLNAVFPAAAARGLGWNEVPLLDAQEMEVAGALPRCIRVLMLWNTARPAAEVRHVYLRAACALRPDLAGNSETMPNTRDR